MNSSPRRLDVSAAVPWLGSAALAALAWGAAQLGIITARDNEAMAAYLFFASALGWIGIKTALPAWHEAKALGKSRWPSGTALFISGFFCGVFSYLLIRDVI